MPMIEQLTTQELEQIRQLSHRGPAPLSALDDGVCERLQAKKFTAIDPTGWRLTTGGWLAYREARARGLI